MNGETFWRNVPNSSRFVEDVVDCILSGKSAVLCFDGEVPWPDIFIDEVSSKLRIYFGTRTIDILSSVPNPDEYLLEKYYSSSERRKYWPTSGSIGSFMAKNRESTIHHRVLCVKDIEGKSASAWLKTISDYASACAPDEENALFLLMTNGVSETKSEYTERFVYSEYVSDFDCLLLCMNILSSKKLSYGERQYVAYFVSIASGGNCGHAGNLAEKYRDILDSPSVSTLAECGIVITAERLEEILWDTQLRMSYPQIERYRRRLADKYSSRLKSHLPIQNSYGELVRTPDELELTDIIKISSADMFMPQDEYSKTIAIRNIRNSLAHGSSVEYKSLASLDLV